VGLDTGRVLSSQRDKIVLLLASLSRSPAWRAATVRYGIRLPPCRMSRRVSVGA